MTYKCTECSSAFRAKGETRNKTGHRFCSKECYWKYRREHSKQLLDDVRCTRCGKIKPRSEYYEYKYGDGKRIGSHCKRCAIDMTTDYIDRNLAEVKKKREKRWIKNRDQYLNKMRERNLEIKQTVLRHYSPGVVRCACCSEKNEEFLSIDHIGGGGNRHRRDEHIMAGAGTYRWLIKNGFPKGFRVLCMNCNFATRYGRVCPHQR